MANFSNAGATAPRYYMKEISDDELGKCRMGHGVRLDIHGSFPGFGDFRNPVYRPGNIPENRAVNGTISEIKGLGEGLQLNNIYTIHGKIEVIVPDDIAEKVAAVILDHGRIGMPGDGVLTVVSLDYAVEDADQAEVEIMVSREPSGGVRRGHSLPVIRMEVIGHEGGTVQCG